MTRIEKTVFISYRCTNGIWARAIYQDLTIRGYDAFFDFGRSSGPLETLILKTFAMTHASRNLLVGKAKTSEI
jgi:hypothetical protein